MFLFLELLDIVFWGWAGMSAAWNMGWTDFAISQALELLVVWFQVSGV